MIISLSPWEILIAAQVGVMRQTENIKLGRTPAHRCPDDNNWQIHIEGALGEYTLAKYLGVHWTGKGKLRAPDVGNMDVRTAFKDNYRLILHKEDPDERIFWLLTGVNGTYTIQGWIRGEEGKKDEYWTDPVGGRPAFFVPRDKLHSPDSFKI